MQESVSPGEVVDAINNKVIVKCRYDDGKNNKTGVRYIEPFAYGLSKSGNEVLRAFQVEAGPNGSLRGTPKWKLFRLDRFVSWNPTRTKFELTPDEEGWANAEHFNRNGDRSMTTVYAIADMGEHSDIDIERAKTRMLHQGRAFNDKRIEGGLPSGFRKRKTARRGQLKKNLEKNMQNSNNGPVVSRDDKFKDYERALAQVSSNEPGPVDNDNAQEVRNGFEDMFSQFDLRRKFPEYFGNDDE